MAEAKLTKKQQKAAQFKAGKKGKAAAIADHPATPDDVVDPDDAPSTSAAVTSTKEETKVPSKKKEKESKNKAKEFVAEPSAAAEAAPVEAPVKEEKRNKKRKRLAAEAEAAAAAGIVPEPTPSSSTKASKSELKPKAKATKIAAPAAPATKTTFGDDGEVASEQAVAAVAEATPSAASAKGSKFILFVGNMAFTTTTDNIAKHFGQTCGEVPTVRLLTRKADPNALANLPASKRKSIAKGKAQDPTQPQSKGCAFVEFKSSDALRKALNFHHTMLEGRKINVELTAGGGGKSENRQNKIKEKNAGLEKERQKLHGKYVAPKNEARKQRAGAKEEGDARPAKRSRTEDAEQGGQAAWSRNSGKERKMPKFMATGANAVRVAPTS
ncbi:hypothetical protein PaG_02291 [Moesziomyces aphidis]|uniref:RRM domain-containing protein n=1 Tax=Moesziomyces aphidis TaxID=84754 RepID=W3VQW2_MOEAP|nr:hypothetical protein PaG_02291 [Moesziomyces aphidis]